MGTGAELSMKHKPAKSAFLRVNAMGLIWFSTGLVSSSSLPSSRKRLRPGQIASV